MRKRADIARLHARNATQGLDRNTKLHVVRVLFAGGRLSLDAISLIENLCDQLAALKAAQRERDADPTGVCGYGGDSE